MEKLLIIDKAKWQIDGDNPVPEELVIQHFKNVFEFLAKHNWLSDEGKEDLEFGIDDTAVLSSRTLANICADDFKKAYDYCVRNGKFGSDIFTFVLAQRLSTGGIIV